MSNMDKMFVFLIAGLILLAVRYEWLICYNIALGFCFGGAFSYFYFIRVEINGIEEEMHQMHEERKESLERIRKSLNERESNL